ncbi:hypothetical protein PFISCL1PPCAC_16963, partial [Pristionchus fissidentatus]
EVSVVHDCSKLTSAVSCVAPQVETVGQIKKLKCNADAILIQSGEVLKSTAASDPPSLPDEATIKASCVPKCDKYFRKLSTACAGDGTAECAKLDGDAEVGIKCKDPTKWKLVVNGKATNDPI